MIHYLVIGHACDEEQEWQFTDSDKELTDDFLEQKFTKDTLEELGYDADSSKEVYIDFFVFIPTIIFTKSFNKLRF